MSEIAIGVGFYLFIGFAWIYICRFVGVLIPTGTVREVTWVALAVCWPYLFWMILASVAKGEFSR